MNELIDCFLPRADGDGEFIKSVSIEFGKRLCYIFDSFKAQTEVPPYFCTMRFTPTKGWMHVCAGKVSISCPGRYIVEHLGLQSWAAGLGNGFVRRGFSG